MIFVITIAFVLAGCPDPPPPEEPTKPVEPAPPDQIGRAHV